MHEALPMLIKGIAAPAAISLAAAMLLGRLGVPWRRYAAAIAFAAGFCAAFALIRPWDELLPARHWQWTFYIALAAAIVGPISAAEGLHRIERWLLLAFTAFIAAWVLVPTWESLQPPRTMWVPLLAAYLFVISAAAEMLTSRISPRAVLGWLVVSAGGTAVLVAAAVSLTYGQLTAAGAAALLGCTLAFSFSVNRDHVQGLIPAYAALIGAWAFVGCIEPAEPVWGLLVAPAAPLALWCCAWGPVAKVKGMSAAAIHGVVVAVVLAAAAWMALA